MSDDICRCEGWECPLKLNCYRYTLFERDRAAPTNKDVSYFLSMPYNKETEECDHQIDRERIRTVNRLHKRVDNE